MAIVVVLGCMALGIHAYITKNLEYVHKPVPRATSVPRATRAADSVRKLDARQLAEALGKLEEETISSLPTSSAASDEPHSHGNVNNSSSGRQDVASGSASAASDPPSATVHVADAAAGPSSSAGVSDGQHGSSAGQQHAGSSKGQHAAAPEGSSSGSYANGAPGGHRYTASPRETSFSEDSAPDDSSSSSSLPNDATSASHSNSNTTNTGGGGPGGSSSTNGAQAAGPKKRRRRSKPELGQVMKTLMGNTTIRCLAVMSVAQGLCTSLMEFAWKCQMRILYPAPSGQWPQCL